MAERLLIPKHCRLETPEPKQPAQPLLQAVPALTNGSLGITPHVTLQRAVISHIQRWACLNSHRCDCTFPVPLLTFPLPASLLCFYLLTTRIHTCLSPPDPSSPTYLKCFLQLQPYPLLLACTPVSPAVIYSSQLSSLAHSPPHPLIRSSYIC